LLFPDQILAMKVEREKNKPTGKTKRKREKGNDIDTSKAVQSNIEGECGFYMLILCWKSFTSERIFSYFYWFFFYLFIYLGQMVQSQQSEKGK
jgi:hypothetical protein